MQVARGVGWTNFCYQLKSILLPVNLKPVITPIIGEPKLDPLFVSRFHGYHSLPSFNIQVAIFNILLLL